MSSPDARPGGAATGDPASPEADSLQRTRESDRSPGRGPYDDFDDFGDPWPEGAGSGPGSDGARLSPFGERGGPGPLATRAWQEICCEASLSRVQGLTDRLEDEGGADDMPVEQFARVLQDTERLRKQRELEMSGLSGPGGAAASGTADLAPREGHAGLTGSVSPSRSPARYRGEPRPESPAPAGRGLRLPGPSSQSELAREFCQVARGRGLSRLGASLEALTPEAVRVAVAEVARVPEREAPRQVSASLPARLPPSLSPAPPAEPLVGFREWGRLREALAAVCPPLERILTPDVFALLPLPRGWPAERGVAFSAELVREHVLRIVEGLQDYCMISLYYADFQGYIWAEPLEAFLGEKVRGCRYYKGLPEKFMPFFLCGISKAFLYFLDPVHRARVRVRDLVRSPFLRQLLSDPDEPLQPEVGELSGPLGKAFRTWFCRQAQEDMYSAYLHANAHGEGVLTEDELAALPGLGLTRAFIRQLFLTTPTYDGCIDYRVYVDLLLAITFPRNSACAKYIFPILDLRNSGRISRADILYYMREVMERVDECCAEGVKLDVDDFVDEIYDVVKPLDGETITLRDLQATRSADILMTYLIDPNLLVDKEVAAQNGIVVGKARAWEP